jgi:hypothetical protein
MTTAATFNGTALSGIVITRSPGRTGVAVQEQRLFGNPGATQLTGGAEPADLDLVLWLTGFASSAAINTYITALEALAVNGAVGSLVLSGDLNDTYASAALRTVERVKVSGQDGPLPNDPDTPGQWTDFIRLRFRRLG